MTRNRLGFVGLLSPSAPCVFGRGNLLAHLRPYSHRSYTISALPPSTFPRRVPTPLPGSLSDIPRRSPILVGH